MDKNKKKIIIGVIIAAVIIMVSLKVFDGGISKDPYVGYWVEEGDADRENPFLVFRIKKEGDKYMRVDKGEIVDWDEGYYDKEQDLVIIDRINLSGEDKDGDFAYRYNKETDSLTSFTYHIKEGKIVNNRTVTYLRYDGEF